jgi:transposase
MKTCCLTDEERALIVGMSEGGMRGARIAEQMSLSSSTIYSVLRRFRLHGTIVSQKSTGRLPKLGERKRRHLSHLLGSDRRQKLAEIIVQMVVKVCKNTLKKVIRSLGYSNRIAVKKPYLSDSHKAQRLQFAREHQHWSVDDWKKVIWTDESCFEIVKISRQIRVWRRTSEKFNNSCLVPTFILDALL